ncbi:MAG: hypothetical protein KF774_03385 [Planctomyces sp.]|nr:hypothetical protein [Planctomyces sp.]
MNLQQLHRDACITTDVILIPCFGVLAALGGVLILALGRVQVNSRVVTWETDPAPFAGVVAGCFGVGLACMAYGAIRWRRIRHAQHAAGPSAGN